MWLVLVTARATLSGSGLARSSSSLDKHWRAWKYFVDKILQRSSGEISRKRKDRMCIAGSWYCVLWIVTVSHSVTQSNTNSRFDTSTGLAWPVIFIRTRDEAQLTCCSYQQYNSDTGTRSDTVIPHHKQDTDTGWALAFIGPCLRFIQDNAATSRLTFSSVVIAVNISRPSGGCHSTTTHYIEAQEQSFCCLRIAH